MTQGLRDGGFTDIHCHGGGGFYFSDSKVENIQKAIDAHRATGTANIVASLVTADITAVKEQIKRLIPFYQSGEIAGIHLEGPYLSHRRCGAHKPSLLREPKIEEIKELIEIGEGSVAMFTIAPELPGSLTAISYMAENHVIAAIGHSDGSYEDAVAGIDAGATLVTHFTNAMSKLKDGDHTFATAVLADSRVHLELIVDGHRRRHAIDRRDEETVHPAGHEATHDRVLPIGFAQGMGQQQIEPPLVGLILQGQEHA